MTSMSHIFGTYKELNSKKKCTRWISDYKDRIVLVNAQQVTKSIIGTFKRYPTNDDCPIDRTVAVMYHLPMTIITMK